MKPKNLFSIKYVSSHTGLSPHLLRAWERRYEAVVPERTQSNRRLYCQDDIRRLKLLKLAVDEGHQISCIAGESTSVLRELLGAADAQNLPAPPRPQQDSELRVLVAGYHDICLKAVMDLDTDALARALSEAAVHLSRRKWIEALIMPLFQEIGRLWSSGQLKIINEHLASNCVQLMIWDMLRSTEILPGAPKIIVGTPAGQRHELGALSAALAATEAGWRPIYVGANLPSEELASAVEQFDAKCIALSIIHRIDDSRLQSELLRLRKYIGPQRCILVGGLRGKGGKVLLRQIDAKEMKRWHHVTQQLKRLAVDN